MVARASVWFPEAILRGHKYLCEFPAAGTILSDCKDLNEYEICFETILCSCKGLCECQAVEMVFRFARVSN